MKARVEQKVSFLYSGFVPFESGLGKFDLKFFCEILCSFRKFRDITSMWLRKLPAKSFQILFLPFILASTLCSLK